jgi:preprotein translocase subunit YajC
MNYVANPTYTNVAAMGGFDFMSMMPLAMIFVIFYFLLLRPQQKKMKQHQEMLGNIKKGDRVVTTGGLIGTVENVEDAELSLEVAENVKVNVVKSMIAEVRVKSGGEAHGKGTSAKFEAIKGGSKKATTAKK